MKKNRTGDSSGSKLSSEGVVVQGWKKNVVRPSDELDVLGRDNLRTVHDDLTTFGCVPAAERGKQSRWIVKTLQRILAMGPYRRL